MKRLLAALLTFSMIVSIVPFSAFADSPDTVVSPNVSAAAQNTSTPTLDADTIQAINSDPLLQGQYLSETSQPTVDTSDVTMEATDGFGKLLVNSINEQNDASSNRIIGVSVSGNTATVEYVSTTDADIVVSIYTDDSAEEMVASGTAYAPAMVENTGSSTATVAISGTIPEYYTVKCYLLDTAEHAPLCKEYTDDSNTEDIVDLETATIDDFPKSRSVNFDENKNTNFAVTRNGVKLIRGSSTPTRNAVVEDDNENLIYQIENADDQFLSLKSGDIIVYPYAEGTVMIVKIKSINQSGNSVILHGDDSLDLDEVFDIVKLSGSANSEDFMVDEATGDSGVSYEGLASGLDETNDYNSTKEFSHTFKISSDDLKGDDGGDDSGWSTSHSLDGTVSIKIKVKLSFNLKDGKESFSFSMPTTESIKISLTGAVKYKTLNLKELSVPISGVFSVGIAPKVVFSATGKAMIETTRSQTIGFKYSKLTGTQNLCTAPTTETDFKLEGTLYVGLDLCPKAKVALANKLELVSLELQAEAGFELTGSMKHGDLESGSEKIHACTTCYTGDLNFKITFGIGLKFLFFHPKVSIPVTNWEIGSIYAAPDFHDFGVGDCPHVKYRVQLTLTGQKAVGTSVQICRTDKDTGDLSVELNEDNLAEIYLEAGDYTATATVDDTHYLAEFTLKDKALNIILKAKEDEIASGTCGENLIWTLREDGTLIISGNGAMTNYGTQQDSIQPPFIWMTTATAIEIKNGVTTIGDNAFGGCRHVTKVSLPTSLVSIGTYAFNFCTQLKQIEIPKNTITLKAHAFNGCALESIKIPDGTAKIESGLFYACNFLEKIELPKSITVVGEAAFLSTNLKEITYAGSKEQWKKIEISAYNEKLQSAVINCLDDVKASGNCGESLVWQLNEAGVLTISGNGEMPDYETGSAVQPEEWKTAQSLIIQDGVTKIGKYTFDRCTALEDAEISGTVKTIEDSAFFSCTSLENILLHDGIETIAASAFNGCSSLQGVVLPHSVTAVGRRAFQGATSLTHVDIMSQIVELPAGIFNHCNSLERVRLPQSIQKIASHAFRGCDNLADIYFDGSSAEWKNIIVDRGNEALSLATIHCTDGDILPTATSNLSSEENSIIPSTDTATSGNNYVASFMGLTPGVNYAVIVSESETDPLDPQNLIYINQFCASSEEYQQTFRTKSGSGITDLDMVYVVAAGSYTFNDSPVNPNPGGSPSGGDTGSDGSSGGSGDGDGSGAGALLLVGAGAAAAAITAGVIMMSPVDVKGRVVLADQAAVPGAKISLLQDGKVVEQTTADDAGAFALKVKRGNYQLTAAYTDANGQIIHQTIDIKAPAKDLVVTF